MIVGPDGTLLAGPAYEEKTILYAEIDTAALGATRRTFEVADHYSKPDVFRLVVDRNPRPGIEWGDSQSQVQPGYQTPPDC